MSGTAEDEIPAAERMARAISDAPEYDINFHGTYRKLLYSVSVFLQCVLDVRKNYFTNFSSVSSDDVRCYNEEHWYGFGIDFPTDPNWMKEASRTGQIFPCNPHVRPAISFGITSKRENSENCMKNCKASESHSPGMFTVHCVCRIPNSIGISLTKEFEGTSTALSILLSRFKTLPKICYYDGSCNLAKSVILRTPLVYGECLIASDRFHYRAHKFNIVFDPDSYSLSIFTARRL